MVQNSLNPLHKIYKKVSTSLDTSEHYFFINRLEIYLSLFLHFFSIHPNPKEYGFGQSLLHEGQLVFHTPPYSLQPVSLQECYEYIGRGNIRGSKHCVDSKSPLPQKHENVISQHKIETSPNSTLLRPGEKPEKPTSHPGKVRDKDMGSPLTAERRGRRFSYTNPR